MNQVSHPGCHAGLPAASSRANAPVLGCLLVLAMSLPVFAQTDALPKSGQQRGNPAITKAATASQANGPAWDSLSARQKEALQPLAPVWGDIRANRKRKWIALSANFASLSPADRVTLHGRMTEWASLSAAERNRARLNFSQSSALTQSEKKAQWEAYQALSPERRQELAAQAAQGAAGPRGAAPALPRPSSRKLAAVPTTRSTPRPQATDKKTPAADAAASTVTKP